MTHAPLALAIAAALSFPRQAVAQPTIAPLDISAVNAISITGEASSIVLSTASDAPYRASIEGERRGWFASWYSSWFFSTCARAASMRIDGTVLRIDVASGSWLGQSDCTARIVANLPAGSLVSVDQAALMAKLRGKFGGVAVTSKAADFTFEGHASDIELTGDAIKAHIDFDSVERDEKIALNANALDVYLEFGNEVPISYSVDATASFVDSALANTPGAKPEITIKGNFVRTTIR